MSLEIGKGALITTDNWFIAPDGCQYRCVWGIIRSVNDSEQVLGIKTNSKSTNWYVEIGNMTLAGCQIHYAVRVDEVSVNFGDVFDSLVHDGKETVQKMRTRIYNAGR